MAFEQVPRSSNEEANKLAQHASGYKPQDEWQASVEVVTNGKDMPQEDESSPGGTAEDESLPPGGALQETSVPNDSKDWRTEILDYYKNPNT